MQNSVATLICPNLRCRASNTERDQFCQHCGTALPKRYLWAMGSQVASYKVGDRLSERYLFRGPHVVLDTQPGLPLKADAEIPETILPYLKLFPYRLHIPQVYTLLTVNDGQDPIVLLEDAPLGPVDLQPVDNSNHPPSDGFHPIGCGVPWSKAWPLAPPLRQLNWLWQMAQLWQPLHSQKVATSLFQPDLLRVEGSLFRLLQLEWDGSTELTLADLGQLWHSWLPQAHSQIAAKLEHLCQQLSSGDVATAEQLLGQLEQMVTQCQDSHPIRIDIAARTDTGTMRDHNEDACYPPHGKVDQNSTECLAIVCDGVGGHAGGEVASGLAIAALQEHITQLPLDTLSPGQVITELEAATCQANDLIAQRNDQEQRQDRERMGTTLAMALAQNHQLYITHVGDSRVYLINARGCYQVTVDDDIASREVRLGYLPYREALHHPASGSLIQALGMASSNMLRPTVQRLILDEDCVFLLCSDGLSDYDRVESLWRDEILPLLNNRTDLVTTSKRLIDLANQLNGHDNITINLMRCHVTPQSEAPPPSQMKSAPVTVTPDEPKTVIPTPQADPPRSKWRLLLVEALLLCGLAGALAYFFIFGRSRSPLTTPSATSPSVNPSQLAEPDDPPSEFWLDSILEIGPKPETSPSSFEAKSIRLWQQASPPETLNDITTNQISLGKGDWVQVMAVQHVFYPLTKASNDTLGRQVRWLQIQVCQSATTVDESPQPSLSPPLSGTPTQTAAPARPESNQGATPAPEPSRVGWVKATDLLPLVARNIAPSEQSLPQRAACSPEPTTGQNAVGAKETGGAAKELEPATGEAEQRPQSP